MTSSRWCTGSDAFSVNGVTEWATANRSMVEPIWRYKRVDSGHVITLTARGGPQKFCTAHCVIQRIFGQTFH